MTVNIEQVTRQCMDSINSKIKNLNKLNIIIIGKSGVGKSTLINSLFRGNFAETGLGKPVTQEIRKIEKQDYPLVIYDTPGFELSKNQQDSVKDEILEIIHKGAGARDINEAIHCIWYCINVGANRTFDSSEIEWLRNFTKENKVTQVPIIVILTQACPKKKAAEMKEYIAKAYGLDKLIDIMSEALPVELMDTLQNVQKASLESKKKYAQAAIATAVAASFGEGFAPIPFSDSAMLVPTQVTMIATITAIFGLDISKSFLTGFVSSTIGSAGATILGKTIVSNLLKLIPGIGTAAGGVISGATAGLLTTALGETYIKVMELIYKGELNSEDLYNETGQTQMKKMFQKELQKKR